MKKEFLIKPIKRAKEHLPPFEALYAVTDDYKDCFVGKKVELMAFGSKSQPRGNHFGNLLEYAAYLVQHVHQKKFSDKNRREISMWFSHLCRMQLELYLLGLSIEKLEHVDIQTRKKVGDMCHNWVIELSAWFCEKVFDEDWNDPRKQIVFEELSGKQRKMWYNLRLIVGGEKPFVRSRRWIPYDVTVELNRQRTEQTSSGPDYTGIDRDRTQKAVPGLPRRKVRRKKHVASRNSVKRYFEDHLYEKEQLEKIEEELTWKRELGGHKRRQNEYQEAKKLQKPAETGQQIEPAGNAGQGKATSGGDTAGDRRSREPLSTNAAAVLEILKALPEHKGLKGREILDELEHRN